MPNTSAGEEHEFYKDSEHLRPEGPPRVRESAVSEMLPVRVSPEMLDALRSRAETEDRSMGWIVRKAIERYLGAE